mgnify:CR=1 FL=1
MKIAGGSRFRELWPLDPEIDFLNHGSFGSCPIKILDEQTELRMLLEREPIRFLDNELERRMDDARSVLAEFLGGRAEDLVFVPNATAGVNAVVRSLEFGPGDELLTTDHEYNACANVLRFVAERTGAKVVTAHIPLPIRDPGEVTQRILDCVTPRTRLALVDHVTSPTGLIFPIEAIVRALNERGVDTLVDGAHSPGLTPIDLDGLGAAYYTGNCHKWICAPKGAAFLHVRSDKQHLIRPHIISHGHNTPRTDRSKFLIEFGWTGTGDPSAMLCVPGALRFMKGLLEGGWPAVMGANRALALRAREIVGAALGVEPIAPESMIGPMASFVLPDHDGEPVMPPIRFDPLKIALEREHRIQIPIFPWPQHPKRMIRLSAQLYNDIGQYDRLAAALRTLLGR